MLHRIAELVVLAEKAVVMYSSIAACSASLADVFAAHVDVGGVGAHGEAGDDAAFDQRVRIVTHMMSRSLQVLSSDSSALTTR